MTSKPLSHKRGSLKHISDNEYLELSGMNNLLETMLTTYIKVKPDDSLAFLNQYFERIKNCHHILGCELSSVKSTVYNRMSFIYYFQEFFKGFSDDDSISVYEFQLLMDLIGVNISKKMLHESAMYINPVISDVSSAAASFSSSISPSAGASIKKYTLSSLKDSLFFSLLFEDWLAIVEQLFKDHGTLNSLDPKLLKGYINVPSNKIANNEPPKEILDAVFEDIFRLGCSEISYDDFRKAFCNLKSNLFHSFVNRSIYHAVPISNGAIASAIMGYSQAGSVPSSASAASNTWGAINNGVAATSANNSNNNNSSSNSSSSIHANNPDPLSSLSTSSSSPRRASSEALLND